MTYLEHQITVQQPMENLFHKACKEGQFDVVKMVNNQFKALSITLNAQHMNGMTHFWNVIK